MNHLDPTAGYLVHYLDLNIRYCRRIINLISRKVSGLYNHEFYLCSTKLGINHINFVVAEWTVLWFSGLILLGGTPYHGQAMIGPVSPTNNQNYLDRLENKTFIIQLFYLFVDWSRKGYDFLRNKVRDSLLLISHWRPQLLD